MAYVKWYEPGPRGAPLRKQREARPVVRTPNIRRGLERGPRPLRRTDPRAFGRAVVRTATRRFNPFALIELADTAVPYVWPLKYPLVNPLGGGWSVCCGPSARPYAKYIYQRWSNSPVSWCGQCGLIGQAISGTELFGNPVGQNARRYQVLSRNNPPGAGGGFRIHQTWSRGANAGVAVEPTMRHNAIRPGRMATDPNIERNAPAQAPSRPVLPQVFREVETPVRQLVETAAAAAMLPPARGWTGLRAPSRGTSESKVQPASRAARIGLMLYRALDEISEGAELIDAIYDTLPKKVRDRWERKGIPGDTFGQYGIEGADFKILALYHNWHLVEPEQAIKNIIKNSLSDAVIGRMQRQLPRSVGNAHAAGEMEFAKILDDLLSAALDEV